MLVALVLAILVPVVFLVWVVWAWKPQEETTLTIQDDEAEVRLLFVAYCAAVEKAAKAARGAPKPLKGDALQRFLEADAEATNAVRRINEIRTSPRVGRR